VGAGLLWIGGHVEVTSAVTRTVVSAQVVGFLDREPTESSHARPGHLVIMTKWAGLEGSTLIVREHPEAARRILGAGRCRSVLGWLRNPGISILPEGRLLRDLPLGAVHDPTEGGVACACHEIAERSKVGMRLEAASIPIREETRLLCREWRLEPLGLLSSGVLLLTAEAEPARQALRRLGAAGIPAARIGTVTGADGGVRLCSEGRTAPLARFDRDELLNIERSPG
jgi:hydrogenase maturation factor